MIIFVLVVVMLFISSVLYRVLMEKKEVESALLADIERLEKNFKVDIEIEKEKVRNQKEISKLDFALISGLGTRNSELKKMIQIERQDNTAQCRHIKEIEGRLAAQDGMLEREIERKFHLEKNIAESGLFEKEALTKLEIVVNTKNKRIRNKNQKAAIKFLLNYR